MYASLALKKRLFLECKFPLTRSPIPKTFNIFTSLNILLKYLMNFLIFFFQASFVLFSVKTDHIFYEFGDNVQFYTVYVILYRNTNTI